MNIELKKSALMGSRMMYSRVIGALFLAGFLVYGVGFSLVTSLTGAPKGACNTNPQ
jgi:hypothetical protein